jgi:hypothetical protein
MKYIHTKKNEKNKKTYTKKHFFSNDGMLTTVWGPSMWHFLHTMSFNYPVCPTHKEKIEYRNFVLQLKHILPCGKCRKNYNMNLQKLPLTMNHMKSRHTFSLYIYKLHELINTMLHKKSGLSFEEVRERYEHFRARCTIETSQKCNSINEIGCVDPLYGKKSKCVLHIVPEEQKCETFIMDKSCIKKRIISSHSSNTKL